jgi:hypothetical protein
LAQDLPGAPPVGGGHFTPEINHGALAADDGFQDGFVRRDSLADGRTDQAQALAQLPPIRATIALAENFHFSGGGSEVAGQCAQKRSFARTVGAQDDPMFAGQNPPVDVLQDDNFSAPDSQAGN